MTVRLATLMLLACGLAGSAAAQQVYRCDLGGKATYQSTPCNEGKASSVSIGGGPTAADASAARMRAQRDQQDAELLSRKKAGPQAAAGFSNGDKAPAAAAGDCERLARQREDAYSRRNAALNRARRGTMGVAAGSHQDQAIGQMNADIAGLEAGMQSRGCKLD